MPKKSIENIIEEKDVFFIPPFFFVCGISFSLGFFCVCVFICIEKLVMKST